VDYADFITTVERQAGVSGEEAERAACTTLGTLAQRLSVGEATDIARRLPGDLRSCLVAEGPPERFHVDEFVRRIAAQVGVDPATAERDARAVFSALALAVGPDEFADLRSELPKDFDPLLDAALVEAPPRPAAEPPAAPILSFDEFLERVAGRTGLDRARAQRAAEAVLQVLASRITGGQIDDLESQLPVELRPALERGRGRTGGRARPMSLEAFVGAIAKLEGVSRSEAAQHARATLATLREAVGEKEWSDTTAQLPGEYQPLLKRETWPDPSRGVARGPAT
jgi:uncharacterized protein (DUF2267 family)